MDFISTNLVTALAMTLSALGNILTQPTNRMVVVMTKNAILATLVTLVADAQGNAQLSFVDTLTVTQRTEQHYWPFGHYSRR